MEREARRAVEEALAGVGDPAAVGADCGEHTPDTHGECCEWESRRCGCLRLCAYLGDGGGGETNFCISSTALTARNIAPVVDPPATSAVTTALSSPKRMGDAVVLTSPTTAPVAAGSLGNVCVAKSGDVLATRTPASSTWDIRQLAGRLDQRNFESALSRAPSGGCLRNGTRSWRREARPTRSPRRESFVSYSTYKQWGL